jgi:hypothetical protein
VQIVGGAAVIRDKQQPERDLGHEQRLDERDRVTEEASWIPMTEVRRSAPHGRSRGDDQDSEADDFVHT